MKKQEMEFFKYMKKKVRSQYLIVLMHLCVSILWHKKTFFNQDISGILRDHLLGDVDDRMLFKIAAMITLFLIVALFWSSIFLIYKKRKEKSFCLFFAVTFSFLLVMNLLLFPNTYSFESDNLSVFTSVILGYADYWHSYFTSAVYLGALYAFYHPIMIPILQSFFWCLEFSIFYEIVCDLTEKKIYRCCVWIAFFGAYLPYIAMNPYRNCMYTQLLFWFTLVLLQLYMKKKDFSIGLCFQMGLIGGVLAFWRSEGIIYLILLPLILIALYGKQEISKCIIIMCMVLLIFFLGKYPQKLAEQKYYGNDYMMINLISMLSDVMNEEGYAQDAIAEEEDLGAIAKLYDPKLIKEYHAMAFQVGNYMKGYRDVSRSRSSREEQNEFMSASIRILLRHPVSLIKGRVRQAVIAIGIKNPQKEVTTIEIDKDRFFDDIYAFGKIGWNVISEYTLYSREINELFFTIIWTRGWKRGIGWLSNVQACEWILLFIASLIFLVDSLKHKNLFFSATIFSGLLMFTAVAFFAPESREAYYYPSFYQLFAVCLVYLLQNEDRLMRGMELGEDGETHVEKCL